MYAAITTLKFQPGSAEDASELLSSLVMPAYAERMARGAWIFTRPEECSAIVIVMYDCKETAEAGLEKAAVDEVLTCDMLAQPLRREVFHVAMGTMSSAPPAAAPSLAPLSGDILSLLAEVSRAL